MTLVELLISMFLLSLAGGVVLGLVVSAKQMWQASVSRVAISQDMQVATSRIVKELRESNVGLITENTAGTPLAFAFVSAQDSLGVFRTDPTGVPAWQKLVIYYVPTGSRRLLRKEIPGSFTSAVTPAQLVGYCDGLGSLCASTVNALRLVPNVADHSAVLTLTCQANNAQGHLDAQSRTITIFTRN